MLENQKEKLQDQKVSFQNNAEALKESESGSSVMHPPIFTPSASDQNVQLKKKNEGEAQDHPEGEHAGEGTKTGGTGGSYDPGEKDDKINKEIPDGELGFFDRIAKMMFMMRKYGPIDMTSTTGTGGFRAAYSPMSKLLSISAICKAIFHNGLTIDLSNFGMLKVNSTGHAKKDNRLQQAANHANTNLNFLQRMAFLSQFTWTPQEITDGMQKLNKELRVVEKVWGGQHSFFVDKEGWRDVRASVGVNIKATQGTATAGKDHLELKSVKTPDNWSNIGATVYSYGDVKTRHNEMVVDDDKLNGLNKTNFLRHNVLFEQNKAILTADAKKLLNMLIIRHRDDKTQLQKDANPANDAVDNKILNKFKLVGRASSEGSKSHNEKLAKQRIEAVSNYLKTKGLDQAEARIETDNKGEEGATEDPKWRRVEVIIGSGEAQHTLSHEFGHVFGLKDEYAINPGGGLGGTGKTTGTQVGHDPLATQIGAPNATSENTDSIMSMGNEVRGQHYATFGEALRKLTGLSEWRLIQ